MMKGCGVLIILAMGLYSVAFGQPFIPASHAPRPAQLSDPYFIDPVKETVVHRSFMYYDSVVLPYTISVGSPEGVHFTINTFNGALIESWRGDFLDASLMWVWKGRGIGISEPRGVVERMGNEKAFASGDNATQWDDTISASDKYKFSGYDVDKQNRPTFRYAVAGVLIEDEILPAPDSSLTRSLHFSSPIPEKFYHRVATGSSITKSSANVYVIDQSIRVSFPNKTEVSIRSQGNKQLLLVKLKRDIQYKINW